MNFLNWRAGLLLLGLILTVSVSSGAHPYHVSVAEVKYNPKTQSLEIAVKLFTDDLEKTLSDLAAKPVTLTPSADLNKRLETYFQKHFRIELAQNKAAAPRFLGFEKQDDAHWFYLAIPVKPGELKNAQLRNQVLVEAFPDQTNLTNLEINGQKKTLIFKEGDLLKPLL